MSKAVINIRPRPDGTIPRFNRIARRSSEDAFAAVGGLVLLLAPRDSIRQGYFATAVLQAVELDATNPSFLLADLVDIQLFSTSVPLAFDGYPYESGANGDSSELLWWYYSAPVRAIDDAVFDIILAAGMASIAFGNQRAHMANQGFEDTLGLPPTTSISAPRYQLSSRIARRARLRVEVLLRHDSICALTDGNLVSPDGVAEVEVCHIRSLAGGPDIVRNALPMTRTVHWGFDNGLIAPPTTAPF